jgi:archaea-specific DNA-binding protein
MLNHSRQVAINVILYRAELSRTMSTSTNSVRQSTSSNEIFIGKKPLMTYVTATLVQLANEPTVVIKARGKSITRAVDVAQIIVKRMDTLGYKIGPIKLGSETVQSDDGKVRNVSTIELPISRAR